jgi:hypothetical protein
MEKERLEKNKPENSLIMKKQNRSLSFLWDERRNSSNNPGFSIDHEGKSLKSDDQIRLLRGEVNKTERSPISNISKEL